MRENEINAQVNEAKRELKPDGKKRGLKIAVAILSVGVVALSSVLTYALIAPSQKEMMLDASYKKSFYDTVEQVGSMDLNLSKALATSDTSALQGYLLDTAVESELAENDIQQLPIKDESKFYTTKLINQIGDYSKFLNKKLARGERLSGEEYKTLENLYKSNKKLKESLYRMSDNMGSDYKFTVNGDDDYVLSGFNEMENLSVEYPELIYDGPFSDGVTNREIKGLKGEEITSTEAEEKFKKYFSEYNPNNVKVTGNANGDIESYCVTAEIDGKSAFALITKKGGKALLYSFSGSCGEVNYDYAYVCEKALNYLDEIGIEGLIPVWYTLYNNAYTINFAGEENGVVIYPDMVKVKLCAETGMIIGLEANAYYTNHTERRISQATIDKNSALNKVSDKIDVETDRLVIVPIGESAEKLCYEFSGKYDGETYYVYIDAESGRQVQMFKVIESTEGTLLM